MTDDIHISGKLPESFEVIKRGLETSEDPAYWNQQDFFNAGRPIDAFAIDTIRSKENGHYYFATEHIQYETFGGFSRRILGHSIKIVDLSYAMILEGMRNEETRPVTTDRHNGPIENIVSMISIRNIDDWLKKMLIHDLSELKGTMSIGAFRSAIGCCGRCLEGTIKTIFSYNKTAFDDSWAVGKLLKTLEGEGFALDPSSKNIANIINSHRIFSVHCKRESKLPIPSEYDSAGVMFLTLGLIERCIVDKMPAEGS